MFLVATLSKPTVGKDTGYEDDRGRKVEWPLCISWWPPEDLGVERGLWLVCPGF